MATLDRTLKSAAPIASLSHNNLPTRRLGKSGPEVTALGFGVMNLSGVYGKAKPDSERLAVLDKAFEAGEFFWDTSDIYGDNEQLIGKWFAANPEKRKKIFLATKFANYIGEDGARHAENSPEYARRACLKSLAALGIDYIDLYYVHRLDGKTPIEKTVSELKKLQEEGKIRHIGLSECSSESLVRASRVVHIDAVQVEYSLFSLDIEDPKINLLKTCRELGTAIVAYSPLGRGMLSGQIRSRDDLGENDLRRHTPRFSEENFPRNLRLVDEIAKLAKRKGVTASQLALAWLLAQGNDIIPIPGTTNVTRLEENLGALDITLTPEEELSIRKASLAAEVAGARYPEQYMKYLFANSPPLAV